MLPQEYQQKISDLRAKYRSPDSPAFIDAIEKNLVDLFKQRDQLHNPVFEKFVEMTEKAVNDLTTLLESDEKMWSEEGKQVARERDVYRGILKAFGVEYVDKAIKNLTSEIDNKIKE